MSLEKIRVLHVVPNSITGGAQKSALELATCLREEHGIEVHFCVLAPRREDFAKMCGSMPVDFLGYGNRFRDWADTFRCVRRLRRVVKRVRPHVLHTHIWIASEIGAMASIGLRVRQVCHSRNFAPMLGPPGMRFRIHKAVTRLLLSRRHTRFIAVSNAVKEHECEMRPWLRDKISVITNGIDTRPFSPKDWSANGGSDCQNGRFVIGMVARFDRGKGHETVVRAIAQMSERRQRVLLRLAGTGPREEEIRNLAKTLGVLPDVLFEGDVSDMPSFYRDLDILVFPSDLPEGLPRAVMEAKTCGVPVIGSSVGGVEETITSGEDGLVVSPNDPGELAGAIRRLAENACLCRRMGERARTNALAQFDVKRVARQVVHVYENVLSGNPVCP